MHYRRGVSRRELIAGGSAATAVFLAPLTAKAGLMVGDPGGVIPPPSQPAAPDIEVVESVGNPPSFWVDLPYYWSGDDNYKNVAVGDVQMLEITLSSDPTFFSPVLQITHTFTAPELEGNIDESIPLSGFTDLDADNYIARVRLERGGGEGDWSPTSAVFTVPAATDPLNFGTVSHQEDAADRTIYTFTNLAHTCAEERMWMMGFAYRGGTNVTISSVTIKGVSATSRVFTTGFTNSLGIFTALIPAGAAGDVVLTLSTSGVTRAMGFAADIIGDLNPVPVDTTVAGTNGEVVNLEIPVNGIAIGFSIALGSSTFTWTGLDIQYQAGVETVMNSLATLETIEGGIFPMSVDWSSTIGNPRVLYASWGPNPS